MPILFYRTKESYGSFSNFSAHPIHVYGLRWPSSEHAFQGMKFSPHRSDLVRKVQEASSPREAAILGRDRTLPLHTDWERDPERVLPFRLSDARDRRLHPEDGSHHEEPLFNRLKDLVMYEVVYAKVTQHPSLRSLLLGTDDEAIVEDSPKDSYWAWGSDHLGENKLGRIFMAVRAALRHGAATRTAFGKPDRVDFVCTPEYPWRPEFGAAEHPDRTRRGDQRFEAFECDHCGHYFEGAACPAT